jgi:hypothetical protein
MKHLFLTLSFVLFSMQLFAQGCSDAGFCSVGAMQHRDTIRHELSVGGTYEKADFGIAVTNPFIQYNANLNRYWSASARVNFRYAHDGTRCVSGLGDVFASINYRLELKDDNQELHFTLGGKAPLSKPDQTRLAFQSLGLATPMDFQTTLGTYDIILGVTYKYKKLSTSIAFQQPLTSTEDWYYQDYKRKGDLLVKPSYWFTPFKNFTVTPSIMAIYRLGEDEFTTFRNADGTFNLITDQNLQKFNIADTGGLTLNAMSEFKYVFAEDYHVTLMAAVPLVNRKVIVDGLRRSYVFALSVGFNL